MASTTPRAAIFDLDGTLSDSGGIHAESWRLLAAEIDAHVDDAWFLHTFGRANQDIIPELLGQDLTQADIERYSDRKEALYRELAAESLELFPGALDLLRGLQDEGWRLGIGSSTPRENLIFTVPLLGLDPFIETWVGMEDVSRHKPEPDTFLEVARKLEVPPANCLVFEDAPAGIEAACRAGMRGIAVLTHHPRESFGHAAVIRPSIGDITAGDCDGWLDGVPAE